VPQALTNLLSGPRNAPSVVALIAISNHYQSQISGRFDDLKNIATELFEIFISAMFSNSQMKVGYEDE